jgi:hypothetical protein
VTIGHARKTTIKRKPLLSRYVLAALAQDVGILGRVPGIGAGVIRMGEVPLVIPLPVIAELQAKGGPDGMVRDGAGQDQLPPLTVGSRVRVNGRNARWLPRPRRLSGRWPARPAPSAHVQARSDPDDGRLPRSPSCARPTRRLQTFDRQQQATGDLR